MTEIDILSQIFAAKFHIIFNVFPDGQDGRGSGKCRQVWEEGRGSQKSMKMCGYPL